MKTTTFDVKGMHCKSCEMLIKESLEDMPGIKRAEASHSKGKVKVEYDENILKEADIKQLIQKEGYDVK